MMMRSEFDVADKHAALLLEGWVFQRVMGPPGEGSTFVRVIPPKVLQPRMGTDVGYARGLREAVVRAETALMVFAAVTNA